MAQRSHPNGTDWVGLISVGFFVIAVGVVFIVTPNLLEEINMFIRDFNLKPLANVRLPAPRMPHPAIYEAIMNLCYIFGVSQIIVLFLRFGLRDFPRRKAETASGVIFWLGMGAFASFAKSLSAEPTGWFSLVSGFLMMIGLVIISRILVAKLLRMF